MNAPYDNTKYEPDSVFGFSLHDAQKIGCLNRLEIMYECAKDLNENQLQQLCKDQAVEKPKACRNSFVRQVKHLMNKFRKTSSDNIAGKAFRDDMNQLMLHLQDLEKAGIANAHQVVFTRWSPDMGSFLTGEDLEKEQLTHSPPRVSKHKRKLDER